MRWAKPGPLPGTQLGTLLLEQRAYENKEVWIWGGAAFMVGAIVIMDIAIILCLTFLQCEIILAPCLLHA